ncbi:MAG: S1C family serine protease [Acidiferrobacterales bacterium]
MVSAAFASSVDAGSDEEAFEQARKYTVKVITRVELPFFGDNKGTSIGAGFIVDASRRWIMTNAHVVARSPSQVKAAFLGGDYYPARKVYVDPYLDVAILEIADAPEDKQLETAELDCEAAPAIGHTVGAFGHPWDLSFTGTRGIISGVTSKFTGMAEMLQTDAPINPGNSGGPLISLKTGKVVGVNTASRRSSQNTNFAVPMSHACRILDLLREGRDPSPPDLPFVFFLDLDEANRLVVAKVDDDDSSPSLREGDIIRRVEGVRDEMHNQGQLVHALRGRLNDVRLYVTRGGKDIVVSGVVPAAKKIAERRGIYASGVLFATNPWRDSEDFIADEPALMVHYVDPGSIGDGQKLRSMDMLLSVDNHSIRELDELLSYLRSAEEAKRKVVLKLIRVGDLDDSIFSYIERPLEINDLRTIGYPPL